MLVLENLYETRKTKKVPLAVLADLTGLTIAEVRSYENVTGQVEPRLEAACKMAKVLGVSGVYELISEDMTAPDVGEYLPSDRTALRAGYDIPLSMACRIAQHFGLSDPGHLIEPPRSILIPLWEVLASGERAGGVVGRCAWCEADAGHHLQACLAELLLGARGGVLAVGVARPRTPRKGDHRGGGMANGLRILRNRVGLTQTQMADYYRIDYSTYAKLDNCTRPATPSMADRIVRSARGLTREHIYSAAAAQHADVEFPNLPEKAAAKPQVEKPSEWPRKHTCRHGEHWWEEQDGTLRRSRWENGVCLPGSVIATADDRFAREDGVVTSAPPPVVFFDGQGKPVLPTAVAPAPAPSVTGAISEEDWQAVLRQVTEQQPAPIVPSAPDTPVLPPHEERDFGIDDEEYERMKREHEIAEGLIEPDE